MRTPVILAVEPDRRQAECLSALTHDHLHADLVVVDSAARALQALAAQVPDVILTSTLLSPRDDDRIADQLRDLGATAAHVQTLTIPIFARSRPAPRARGMLSAFRRRRVEHAADGCDPAAFGAQVAVYLERAALERQIVEEPAIETPEIAAAAGAEDAAAIFPARESIVVEGVTFAIDTEIAVEIDLSEGLEAIADAQHVSICEDDQDVWTLEPFQTAEPLLADEALPDLVPALDTAAPRPILEILLARGPVEAGPPQPLPQPVIMAEPEPVTGPESITEPAPIADPEPIVQAPVPVPVLPPAPRPKGRKRQPKPVQDEWGFFDPEQCGFAALVARLDEIAESGDADQEAAETTVRVLDY